MQTPKVIDAKNLKLTYRSNFEDVEVLKGLDLEVFQGERVALIGPSGSGKSSMLMLLSGLEKVTSGDLKIMDQNVSNFSEDDFAEFRKDNIGIIFQSFHLIPTMTALENVSIPLELQGKENVTETAQKWLDKVKLSHRGDHFPAQLSGGEQQRVAIARALAADAELILADEPTGNLDENTGEKVAELLFDLNRDENRTLLVITHDISLAQRADRIFALENGKLVEQEKVS